LAKIYLDVYIMKGNQGEKAGPLKTSGMNRSTMQAAMGKVGEHEPDTYPGMRWETSGMFF
jgi:hypothetical protein